MYLISENCQPGSEFIPDRGICRSCQQGYYRDGSSGPLCTRCPDDNYTTSGVGAQNVHMCTVRE